jgi:hypothetical protein
MIRLPLLPGDLVVLEAALCAYVEKAPDRLRGQGERLLEHVRSQKETESPVLGNVDYSALEARMLARVLAGALASHQEAMQSESPTGRLPKEAGARGRE